ncbi:unnamed protein product, partial [Prorocentrum cordatum]
PPPSAGQGRGRSAAPHPRPEEGATRAGAPAPLADAGRRGRHRGRSGSPSDWGLQRDSAQRRGQEAARAGVEGVPAQGEAEQTHRQVRHQQQQEVGERPVGSRLQQAREPQQPRELQPREACGLMPNPLHLGQGATFVRGAPGLGCLRARGVLNPRPSSSANRRRWGSRFISPRPIPIPSGPRYPSLTIAP